VPLGMGKLPYLPFSLGSAQKVVLCKAAVGRMLPSCPGGQLDPELALPTGYHSLYVPALTDVDFPQLAPDIPAYWQDNYFIPNIYQVLITHLVTYTVQPEPNLDLMYTPRTLASMPAVVDECKFCGTGMPLDRFCRETGMAACMDCKTSGRYQDKDYSFDSVEELNEVMMSEIAGLAAQREPLSEQLAEFSDSCEQFKAGSNWRASGFKGDVVDYIKHYLKVGEAVGERQFDTMRNLSDMDRLQEFYCYNQQTAEKQKFINSWKNMEAMGESITARNDLLESMPQFHGQLMALEEKNRRIVGLRRELNHSNEVIQRLTRRLQDSRALSVEDEELIVALSSEF